MAIDYETLLNFNIPEVRQTLTKQRFPVIDGDVKVPEEPGLGIELDEEVVDRYRVG